MAKPKGSPKTGGRAKGTPNKLTSQLKEMILEAAELAGEDMGGGGTVKYLRMQATLNPVAFMSLLGRVLPMQVGGDPDGEPIKFTRIELIGVSPSAKDS
ncbi:hypothetical protein [Bradyrhizobium sp. 930_D9_N1_4]|uniref:hypothetical protein n=1 Tax=Bradyrhizobium sp. 930_D9_N1_4 TaxID=3240374 RepID=UPI003F88FA29